MVFSKSTVRRIVGGLISATACLALFISLAEGVFFSNVVLGGAKDILENGYGGASAQLANYLVANGRVSYLPLHTKMVIACASIVMMYVGISLFLNAKNKDFSLRNVFSHDYWIKFNAISYRKTKVKKIT